MCVKCFETALETELLALSVQNITQLKGRLTETLSFRRPFNCGEGPSPNFNERNKAAKALLKKIIPRKQLSARVAISQWPGAMIGQRLMSDVERENRDLDRLSRLILSGPLSTHICVAACWSPTQWESGSSKIIISTNQCSGANGSYNSQLKDQIHSFLVTYKPTPYGLVEKLHFRQEYADRAPTTLDEPMRKYLQDRDFAKLRGSRVWAAIKSRNFYVVNSEKGGVHAELRILEHLEWFSREYDLLTEQKADRPIYIGVSLLCCSKCAVFFHQYRRCPRRLFLPLTRGQHGVMDSNWVAPPHLSSLINNEARVIAISDSVLPQSDLPREAITMTADLSDSDTDD